MTAYARKIAFQSVCAALVASGFAFFATDFWMLFGPLAFGVPHLVSDVRTLLRPRETGLLVSGGFVVVSSAFLFALRQGGWDLHFAYLHNAIAIGIAWALCPKEERQAAWVLVLVFAAGTMLFSVPAVRVARPLSALAFGQAMHYFAWLRAIPAWTTPKAPSLRMAACALAKDIGPWVLVASVVAWISLLLFAAVRGATEATRTYLSVAAVHGPLELLLLSRLFRRRPSWSNRSPALSS